MTNPLKKFRAQILIGLYVVLALGTAAVLSPFELSIIPVLYLGVFLFFTFWRSRPLANLSVDLYVFLSFPLIYELVVNQWISWVFAIPLLLLLGYDLERIAIDHEFTDSRAGWHPSKVLVTLAMFVLVSLGVSLLLGKWNAAIAVACLMGYVTFLCVRMIVEMPQTPLEVVKEKHRILADNELSFKVRMERKSKRVRYLYIPKELEWAKVEHQKLVLSAVDFELDVTIKPNLSGPTSVCVNGFILDRHGLLQRNVALELADLLVVPRAKYALWLAERYLATSGAGSVTPMVSVKAAAKLGAESRSGFEYIGNRLYQPGDSLKNIDWKHSSKLQEIVVKEFDDQQASAAVLLVNLVAGDEQEADRLVYALITTAITLADEGIPTSLVAYNQESVQVVTENLEPRQFVLKALELSRDIVIVESARKYFQSADPLRLRTNIRRLSGIDSDSVRKIIDLLDIELQALRDSVVSNPATIAFSNALSKTSRLPTVVFLSAMNHDEEAVQMAKYTLWAGNQRFIDVSPNGKGGNGGRTRQ
ncbi:MAG: DUF58 domain-containing protein [Chloroflexi bacterium]|nr:DUF58 domain-containing protein [Chloroflexota bacterium]